MPVNSNEHFVNKPYYFSQTNNNHCITLYYWALNTARWY